MAKRKRLEKARGRVQNDGEKNSVCRYPSKAAEMPEQQHIETGYKI